MARNNEKGKVTMGLQQNQLTVNLSLNYTRQPVVKITPTDNVNVYLSDVTNNYFIINKDENISLDIHYIVIESDE